MLLNLKHAFRRIRKRPFLATAVIVSLATGLGCALASASVVNTVLFRAIPYRDADRLVFVWENHSKQGVGLTTTSILNYRDLKASVTSFDELGAFIDEPVSLDGQDGSEPLLAYHATAGLLEATGVAPLVGRVFSPAEDSAGGSNVVVLSHRLWQRRFGNSSTIVGTPIRLSGSLYTVIGIMPEGFALPPVFAARLVGTEVVVSEADLWLPLRPDTLPPRRERRSLFLLGRLKPGFALAKAQAEGTTIAGRLAADYPDTNAGMDFTLLPVKTQVLENVRPLLLLLFIVGALVLIIATANAAHLLLVESLSKRAEIALRAALGATTRQVASQLLTFTAPFCAVATAAALLVAAVVETPIAAYTKANIPRLGDVSVDWRVRVLAVLLCGMLMVATSALPIFHVRRTALAGTARTAPSQVGRSRWRRPFVALQLAIGITVLAAAGLLFRSVSRLAAINPGLSTRGVTVAELMLPETHYRTAEERIALQSRVLDAASALPGSSAVAVVDSLPFGSDALVVTVTPENLATLDALHLPQAAYRAVSAGYFSAFSIPLVDGRSFDDNEARANGTVAIVNDAFAKRFFPGEYLLGRRIKIGNPSSTRPWLQIVGIVGSVRSAGLALDPQPEVFVPFGQNGAQSVIHLVVKGSRQQVVPVAAIKQLIERTDQTLAPTMVAGMDDLVARSMGRPYFYARVFGVLAAVAILLSLLGVYAASVNGVRARATDIAVRLCLGASRADIVRTTLREASIAISTAVIAGVIGAFVLQQQMASLAYGVHAPDWAVSLGSAAALSALAFATVYAATRQVLSVEPAHLLRTAVRDQQSV